MEGFMEGQRGNAQDPPSIVLAPRGARSTTVSLPPPQRAHRIANSGTQTHIFWRIRNVDSSNLQ